MTKLFHFSVRQCYMLSALYAIRPSVCLTVRHTGESVKTVKYRIMQVSIYNSSLPLAFWG